MGQTKEEQTMIKAFFNPRKEGDTFSGLMNGTVEGTVADKVIRNLPEFLSAAGRDYHIRKVPAFQRLSSGDFAEIEGQFNLTRSSDERVVSPHTVTGQYAPTSLLDLSEEIAPWVEAGWATPDGVYDAREGSLEILSLRLDAGEDPTGDEFLHYAILQNTHAIGGTVKGKIIDFRIICGNTFARAVATECDFSITHRTTNGSNEAQSAIMRERSKLAIQTWQRLKEHVSKLAEKVNVWKDAPITLGDATMLTERLLGIEGKKPEDISSQAENRKEAILAGFNVPKFGTYGASAYDWLNAVTFDTSSPFSPRNVKSKVGALERVVRNVSATGSGFAFEGKAEEVLAEFIGAQ